MQVEALKIYCDVVRFHSFSRGAEANHVLQAAVSQTINKMEKHLGVALIDRSCRPWKLTVQGKLFYDGSREVVERYHELEDEVRGSRTAVDAVVRVAAIYSVNLRDMSRCVQRFNQQRPGSRVELQYLHPARVCERLLNDEVDIGIVSFPEGRRGLSVIPWLDEEMAVVCPPQHRFAKLAKVPVKQLDGETFVAFESELVIRKKVDQFLKSHGVEVKVVLRFDNIEAVKRGVEAGTGISILPLPTLEHELRLGTLVAVPFAGARFVRPLGIVHRKGKKLYPNTEAFIELLRNGHGPREGKKG